MSEKPDISFCTLCKGRRWQMEHTLAENIEAIRGKSAEIVIVDFDSQDGLSDWILRTFPQALNDRTIRLFKLLTPMDFSISIGKNFAHRLAEGRIVFNLDADNFIGNAVKALDVVDDSNMLTCLVAGNGSCGRVAMTADNFRALGGYDESFAPAGYMDIDLVERGLAVGLVKVHSKPTRAAIRNSKEETTRHTSSPGKSWAQMNSRNRGISRENIRSGRLEANIYGFRQAIFHNVQGQKIELSATSFQPSPQD